MRLSSNIGCREVEQRRKKVADFAWTSTLRAIQIVSRQTFAEKAKKAKKAKRGFL